MDWKEASGGGTLATYVILHRAPPEHLDRLPYVYALVDLNEGPRIVSNIVHADPTTLSIGQRLKAVFERQDGEGQTWPEFQPEA